MLIVVSFPKIHRVALILVDFKISVNYNPSNKPLSFKLSYATETPIDVTVQKLMLLQAKVL